MGWSSGVLTQLPPSRAPCLCHHPPVVLHLLSLEQDRAQDSQGFVSGRMLPTFSPRCTVPQGCSWNGISIPGWICPQEDCQAQL